MKQPVTELEAELKDTRAKLEAAVAAKEAAEANTALARKDLQATQGELDQLRQQFCAQEAREATLKNNVRLNLATEILQGMLSSRTGLPAFHQIPEPHRRIMIRTAFEFVDALLDISQRDAAPASPKPADTEIQGEHGPGV